MPLAQSQSVQSDTSVLGTVLALEGTLELAAGFSAWTFILDVSVGHERHLPFGRTWYLPGDRPGLLSLGPKERLRRS